MIQQSFRDGLPESLGRVSADLQEAFQPALTAYVQHVRNSPLPNGKVINDPIWQTVRVEPWEVVVLDCPVVQRLRGVHQLGLIDYVYPGANHTRFEHSIGILHQTQRVIEKKKAAPKKKKASMPRTF